MKHSLTLLLAALIISAAWAHCADGPPPNNLQLWLDASDASTVLRNPEGRLLKWTDKSGNGHDAINSEIASHPRVAHEAMNGKNVLRFDGQRDGLEVHGSLRTKLGPLTVFVVSQRLVSGGASWQRLVSSHDGATTNDLLAPNIRLMAPFEKTNLAYAARVDDREYSDVMIKALAIGHAAGKGNQYFCGDIAEVLIYDRTFLSEDESRSVLLYLKDKWNAQLGREERGWIRVGVLPNPPIRKNDRFPLSDQDNVGKWVRVAELSDEFEGDQLERLKWRPEYPGWKGRQPARFNPANVSVSGGQLHLVMSKGNLPKELEAPGYTNYSSAAVDSLARAHYGYYEVMARPMNSAGSSSWWFSRTDIPKRGTEIDVFEVGGKALGYERKLNMNLHVWETPQEKRHWNVGTAWIAPWRFADAFHVYGFEWDEQEIKYYVDGVMVWKIKNTDWHDPLHMQFDSETMPTWFGMPKDEDLPSTYSVEYVRTWRKQVKP